MKTKYKKIVIIGNLQITIEVIDFVAKKKETYGYDICCIEYRSTGLSTVEHKCMKKNIDYIKLEDKESMALFLGNITESTLIISAGNNYIFPPQIVDNHQFTIINFHSALLPKYKGSNTASWVIYYGEKETGATWHYVTNQIDAGDIIIQKKCEITPETTALALTRQIMEMAIEGFIDIYESVLTETVTAKKQENIPSRMCYAKEIPGNGYVELGSSGVDIYRMLRAIDYGKIDIFPKPKVIINEKEFNIKRYKKVQRNETSAENKIFYNSKENMYIYLNNEFEIKLWFEERRK